MALFKHKQPDAAPVREDRTGTLDLPFLLLVVLLTLVGLLMMFSASYARANWDTGDSAYYFRRQALFALGGMAAMLLAGRLNYFIWFRTAMLILAGSIFLLALVPLIGVRVNGAKRWLKLGIQFQPSDVAKLGMILAFAAMMSVWQDKMESFRYGVLPYVGIMGVIAVLLYLEPHLSATLIIGITGATMMLLGGTKKSWLALFALAAAVLVFFYLQKNGYAGGRVTTWLDPESDALGDGYQGIQSRYAIGSGGFLGLGLGRSRQKYLYLPEEHNDYIFAIVCEELGFVGAVGIILLFVLLILRGYWIAIHARDRFGTLVAAGLTTKLGVQVFLNMGVVTGLLPPTGISLPFFSYGGTALLLQLFEMGVILAVSRWCVNQEAVAKAHG
ncbi:MAG: putative lipid II flippase FtsW [Oscillospiraceae bacterium]|nr:putative lipid II flippase FtsW [Oscillospiraceae bacterium]MBR7010945.1 putative lipid II flippase FtsW [Oscillospiraceae bacterium]